VPPETSFVEHNHVVQALAPDGPDHPFNIGTLPGLAKCRKYLLDAHRLHLVSKILPRDLIAIPQHIAWRGLPRKRFAQLLHTVHSAVGWAVTAKCSMRRRSCANTRKT
jgi:hypothetical protein